MLLVHPPVFKPCQMPAGIAALASFLESRGRRCTLLDANVEGLEFLVRAAADDSAVKDTWTRRALKGRARNWDALKRPETYRSPDRYMRAVVDLERALGALSGGRAGLSSFRDPELSPLKSADLLESARDFGANPFFPYFSARLEGLLAAGDYKHVGFSLNFLDQALCAFAMAGFVRARFPKVRLVLGGGLVNSWLSGGKDRAGLFSSVFDHVCGGPGQESLSAVLGLEGAAAAETPRLSVSGLPLGKYLAPGAIVPLGASSGCWWNRCAFCPERAEGGKWRAYPAAEVMGQARALCAEHKPVLIHFLDNALSPAFLRHMAREGGPGADWYGFARFCPELADEGFCAALKNAGCRMLKLGLESGSQEVLDAMDKGLDLSLAARVLENLAAVGIRTYVYLLFGTPAENEARAAMTLDFCAAYAQGISFLNAAIFNLPRFAALEGTARRTEFSEADLSLYCGFNHPMGWDRRAVRNFLDRKFKRHPAIRSILRRDPPVFTSNHAAFF